MSTTLFLAKTAWGNEFYHDQEDVDQEEATDLPPTKVNEKEFDQRLLIPKTKPEPCDKEVFIYTLTKYTERNISKSGYNKTMSIGCSR